MLSSLEGVVSPAGCIELQVAHSLVWIALFLSLLKTNIEFPDLMKFGSDFVYNLDAWKDLMSTVHHSPCFVPSTQCLKFIIALSLFLLSSLKSVGDRSFSFITPTVWNSLPASLWNLPTFSDCKSRLKAFLFQQAFPQI